MASSLGNHSSSHADEELMDIDCFDYHSQQHHHHHHEPQAAKRTSSGVVKSNPSSARDASLTTTSSAYSSQVIYYNSPSVPSSSNNNALSVPAKPGESVSRRRKIKARRKMAAMASGGEMTSAQSAQSGAHYICVLDTNVILVNLNGVKSLINNSYGTCDKGGFSIAKIIVPMVVLQELDGLKMGNRSKQFTVANTAQSAIKFLHSQLKQRNGILQGEPDKNPQNRMSECTLQVENNDDRIIDCCIRLTELYRDKTVILLSNDINLQNKALTWRIEATAIDAFINKLKSAASKVLPQERVKQKFSPKKAAVQSTNGKSSSSAIPTISAISSATSVGGGSASRPITQAKAESMETEQTTAAEGELKHKRHKPEVVISSKPKVIPKPPPPTTTVPTASNPKTDAPKITTVSLPSNPSNNESLKAELETTLLKFIVSQLEKQYGKTWATVFSKFNPKVATLTDSLKLLNSNWMGVFSDAFNRDAAVKFAVKSLLDPKNANNSTVQSKHFSNLLSKVKAVL